MEMDKAANTLLHGETQTSPLPKPPSCEAIAGSLERHGWTHAVALQGGARDEQGNAVDDFAAAVRAIQQSCSVRGKGLIVSGEYGCGKTSLVTTWRGRLNLFDMNNREHRAMLDPSQYPETYPLLFGQSVFIDDLGAELRSHYGESDYSEARDFICEFHARKGPDARLYVTTNLRMRELLDRYGGRLVDRLKDLCVPLRMFGTSKREWCLG